MYYCILDFEATCWKDKEPCEIIEFPSILYKYENNNLKFLSEFHEYVKPINDPILSDFCIKLTGITQDKINDADILNNVYERHYKWLKKYVKDNDKLLFVTCGDFDMEFLNKEIKIKNLKFRKEYLKFINIKKEFEKFYKVKAGGMTNMLKYLNLELDGRLHSGIDDTRNIAKIFKKMTENNYIF